MIIYRFMTGVIAAAALTWASPGSAGWVIDETVKGGAGGRQQVMMQANRIKSVVFEGGKPVSAFVVDLDAQTLTQVDYKERYYFTATVQEYVQTFRGAMSGAMKEMQEALKGMSAEERKMMEQMMPQQAQPDCREPRTELRKTGQQATVAGYPVRTVERSGTTVEVVKAESRAIPAEEFQPPAGFARKSLREVMKL